jgi:hypothetical protein
MAMALKVCCNGITKRSSGRVVDGSDLNELLELVANEGMTLYANGGICRLVVINKLGNYAENQLGSGLERLCIVVPLEPFLGLENSNLGMSVDFNKMIVLLNNVECLVEICEATTV